MFDKASIKPHSFRTVDIHAHSLLGCDAVRTYMIMVQYAKIFQLREIGYMHVYENEFLDRL
jgi:hypothetical protein